MIVATYASLRTARVTLGDAEMRSKYDEQERVKAREYAEDVDDDNTYLGAAKRKVFGVIYYGIYGGIVAWTVIAVVACLAYVACKALASIPNAPPLFGRCADRCGSVILWLNPGWSYGVHARVLRAEYGPRGDAVGVRRVLVPLQFVGDCVEINQ